MREDVVYGRHPVLEALRSGRPVEKLWLQEGVHDVDAIREIRRRAHEERIPFTMVAKAVLDRMSQGGPHQGVAAAIATQEYAELEDVLARARAGGEEPRLLVLDEIQDPRNLGSLIRTADAAGFHGVIVPARRAAGLTGVVSKSSAGADAWVPMVRVPNIARFLKELTEEGWHVIGADSEGTVDYREAHWTPPVALVMGGEHKGLGRLVGERCTQVVKIPMKGQVASLNVSVAGALLMYEAIRPKADR